MLSIPKWYIVVSLVILSWGMLQKSPRSDRIVVSVGESDNILLEAMPSLFFDIISTFLSLDCAIGNKNCASDSTSRGEEDGYLMHDSIRCWKSLKIPSISSSLKISLQINLV